MNMVEVNNLEKYIIEEVDVLANTVKTTLGPCGANVIINDGFNTKITKDGVSVARAIKKNKKSPVIDIIQQVSEKTGTEAGDGTTSSTIFAQALIHSIYKNKTKDSNLLEIKKNLDSYKNQAIKLLNEISVKQGNLYDVAYISSNGDSEISQLTVEIIEKTGLEGIVTFKESETSETVVNYIEGLKWNTGYLSPNFVTNDVTMECELSNVRVEIYNDKLTSLKPIINVMDICAANNIPLLLAVKDIEYDILNTIIYNQVSGKLKVCVIKIPGHGSYKQDNVDDLISVIGNNEIIDKVLITKTSTLFINSSGNEETKNNRIAHLKHRLTLPDVNIQDINNRIANINNGYATVYVGGDSAIEIKEKIDRFEDAVCAVKSAIEEGIVIGGGNTLRLIGSRLTKINNDEVSYNAIKQACNSIIEQLWANYKGIENYEFGTAEVPDGIIGYRNGEIVKVKDAKEFGLIDPTKVIRLIIENGISIAGTLITTKCLIINNNDNE